MNALPLELFGFAHGHIPGHHTAKFDGRDQLVVRSTVATVAAFGDTDKGLAACAPSAENFALKADPLIRATRPRTAGDVTAL
jgi:hypothetical protein